MEIGEYMGGKRRERRTGRERGRGNSPSRLRLYLLVPSHYT